MHQEKETSSSLQLEIIRCPAVPSVQNMQTARPADVEMIRTPKFNLWTSESILLVYYVSRLSMGTVFVGF